MRNNLKRTVMDYRGGTLALAQKSKEFRALEKVIISVSSGGCFDH